MLGLLPDEATSTWMKPASSTTRWRLDCGAWNRPARQLCQRATGRGDVGALRTLLPFVTPPPGEREVAAPSSMLSIDRGATDGDVEGPPRRPTTLARIVAAATLVMCVSGTLLFLADDRAKSTLATSENGAVERRTSGSAATHRRRGGRRATSRGSSNAPARQRLRPLQFPVARRSKRPPGGLVAIVLLPRRALPRRSRPWPFPPTATVFGSNCGSSQTISAISSRVEGSGHQSDPMAQRLDRTDLVRDQASVSMVVPSKLLRAQHYALDLTGRGAGGPADVIGSYTVRIAQP